MGMSHIVWGRVYRMWRALGCVGRGLALFVLGVVLLTLFVSGWRAAGWTLLGFWAVANVLIGGWALIWSLLRPRLWRMIASPAFGWSFVGAFLSAFLAPLWSSASASATGEVSFGSAFLLLMAGIAFGSTLVMGFFVSVMGAALGLMAQEAGTEQSARWGLAACWVWQAVGLLGLLIGLPSALAMTLWLGTPLLTLGTVRRLTSDNRLTAWLQTLRLRQRVFQFQGRWGTRVWRFDARGAAIGAGVALFTWLVWQVGMLQSLQANSLIWLIQFRNEPWVLQRRGGSLELSQSEAPRRIVLGCYDQESYALVSQSSECALLTRIIRQLRAWRVRLILVPLPLLTTDSAQPEPLQQLTRRNRRDLNLLKEAALEAGNVIWIAPTLTDLPAEAKSLIQTGKAVGVMERVRYFAPALPMIERGQGIEAPALVAMQVLDIRTNTPARGSFLLTDFYGEQSGSAFTQIPLSTILTGKPFYWTGQQRVIRSGLIVERAQIDTATPPKQLFAERIVILPFLSPDFYTTPIGRMDGQELVAHQLASLLRGAVIRTPLAGWTLVALLALGLIAGHLCLRSAPIQAWWTAVLMGLVVWLSSIALFIVGHLWFDPLLPLLSVGLTALLVSQLTFVSESAERARHRALLQRLVAPEVAEQLLEDFETRLQAGGMRSRIAVLFADIRNFTRFADTHTPEQVIERLNRLLGALTSALHAHRGILDKYTGDGLMAIFAAHLLPEQETEEGLICRAVRAAMAMQGVLQSLNREDDASGDVPLGVGIGLHFGEAVLGLLGSAVQFNYTAIGRAVVISARLQALASAGEIVMSETVYQVAHRAGVLPELPPETVQLKGMTEPLVIYRLRVSKGQIANGEPRSTSVSPGL